MSLPWNPPPPAPGSDASDDSPASPKGLCMCARACIYKSVRLLLDGADVTDTSIGDTVLSKSWALSVLVRAVESVAEKRNTDREWQSNLTEPAPKFCNDDGDDGKRESGEGGGDGEEGASDGVKGEKEEEVERGKKDDNDDLDKDLEEDMCRLWDASMNKVSP